MSKPLVLQWACRGKFSPKQLRGDLALARDHLKPTAWFVHIFSLTNPNAGLLASVLLAGELYF